MVIVDSSVWISYLSGMATPETIWIDHEMSRQRIGLIDLILCEVLQGARVESAAEMLLELSKFEILDSGGDALAIASARCYHQLRTKGFTIRTTVDCLIATFCVSLGHSLLHRDRDFEAFERHLGLSVIHPAVH